MIDQEEAVMEIIVNAGQSRSLCFEALRAARQGEIEQARILLHEADTFTRQAHKMQTRLIEQDAGEGRQPMTLIMVHAQDHLMTSMLARELSEEIIHLYQRDQRA
ncbi:PTS lactose/cellobiose transporter subunit IIA [Pantoea agglomerans]|uniref:PTS lactose/cellobiose transporter subunit IIA n=1 Tax=Enterobacter agglomerans TaxID=549 RepID=UPI000E20E0AC|nr:PTS lactose/cellobiose transporter subunit IIA [Pantoea agglomerans]UJL39419.1 PTS lactose/cellobiose transporter subunit IIA [Pantoea agglomerans]